MNTFESNSKNAASRGARKGFGFLGTSLAAAVLLTGPLTIDFAAQGDTGLIRSANAAKPDNPGGGKPDNPGGGNGGGKPDNPGGGKPTGTKGDLYSDLVVLYRNEEGLPLLTEVPTAEGPVSCLQPIAAGEVQNLDTVTNPADGKSVSLIPLGGTGVDGEECDVDPDYASLVQEVLFGRLNLGRAPSKVLKQQLRDVTGVLASSVDPIQIDEAGRFVAYVPAATEIDSPGNNLAIHKQLQVAGELLDQTQTPIVLPSAANDGVLDHAAAALGAAAGKGDFVDLDLLVYNNRILNIPNETVFLPTMTGDGITGEAGEVYIDYGNYTYSRSDTFPGCIRGMLADFPSPGNFTSFSGTIMDCVFGTITQTNGIASCAGGNDFTGVTGVQRFAQRADDARAVIAFVHGNAVADSTAILPEAQAGVDQAGESAVCDNIAEQ